MPRPRMRVFVWSVLASLGPLGAGAQTVTVTDTTDSGAYLAARQATRSGDFETAIRYYDQVLSVDPTNPTLLDSAMTAHVAMGRIDRAGKIADRMLQNGTEDQLANMVLFAREVSQGNWQDVLDDLEAGQSVGPLFDDLLRGWSLLGTGDASEALKQFDKVIGKDGVGPFGAYHKALALASVGDFESADEILSGRSEGEMRLDRTGIVAFAEILSQLDRNEDALDLIDKSFEGELDGELTGLRQRLQDGERVPFDVIDGPQGGAGLVYLSIAGALGGETSDAYRLLYARLGEYLSPDDVDAILMIASILEKMEQHDLAIDAYRKIPRDDPAFSAAEMGRADALYQAGREDAAIEVLQQLTEIEPDNPTIFTTLGDMLRRMERFDQAADAYDQAISRFKGESESQWVVYFARAISYERTDRWDKAEADFRKALELNPNQPQVLNYLGYSYVEAGENLDEALDMIQRAVAARPDSGYIADSLGWVYYRLGHYRKAVEPMERAVELEPVDPVVNDHLGDVYWAVGRKLEAEFQWKRALSFIDDETSTDADPDRIRRKLKVGLDEVLAEEGEKPLSVAEDDG